MPKIRKANPVDITYFENAAWAHELDEHTLRTKINGGVAMSAADQQACAEAQKNGDYNTMQQIISQYKSHDDSGSSSGNSGYSGGHNSYNPGSGSTSSDGGNNGGSASDGSGHDSGFSHSSGSFAPVEVPNEYYVASDRTAFSLNGLKEIEYKGENLLVVNYADLKSNPSAFELAANFYLFTGKDGTAGNKKTDGIAIMNDQGQIIHVFKDEKVISNFRDSLCPVNSKGVEGFIGGISNIMGKASDISGLFNLDIDSNVLGEFSKITGVASLVLDGGLCLNNPSFDNKFNVAMDVIGFIPGYGPAISFGLSTTKHLCEDIGNATEELINAYGQYKIEKIVDMYSPEPLNIGRQCRILAGDSFVAAKNRLLGALIR